jgi:hypothetical protein
MRKIISFGITTMLILFAVGMWASAQPSHQDQSEISKSQITTFDLMVKAIDLPAHGYDAF